MAVRGAEGNASAAPGRLVHTPPAEARQAGTPVASPGEAARQRPGFFLLELFLVVAVCGAVILVGSLPAFGSYYFSEDFFYLGQMRSHGNDFVRAVLSPTDNIFFRPVFASANILWRSVFPLDSFQDHVRNFVLTLVDVGLLYWLISRITTSRLARLAGIGVFAVSRIHFVNIGYINVFDSIISLFLILATALSFDSYLRRPSRLTYALTVITCTLSAFTKDYGLVVCAVLLSLLMARRGVPRSWSTSLAHWAPRLAFVPVVVVGYLILRSNAVGPLPSSDRIYSPMVLPSVTGAKLLTFTSVAANLSLGAPDTTGARAVSSLLGNAVPWIADHAQEAEWVAYAAAMVLVLFTVLVGHKRRALVLGAAWAAAYFAPTLLTRNIQMYYMYEPLAGVALALAVMLDGAKRWLQGAWLGALVLFGAWGIAGDQHSLYAWQFVANASRQVDTRILEPMRGQAVDSVTFISRGRTEEFWQQALGNDRAAPMIPELLGDRQLKVRYIAYDQLRSVQLADDDRDPIFDLDNGLVPFHTGDVHRLTLTGSTPGVLAVSSDGAPKRQVLVLSTDGATPATVGYLDGQPLETTVVSPSQVQVTVPTAAVTAEGTAELYIDNGVARSDPLPVQEKQVAVHLAIDSVVPSEAVAGHPFQVQPDGSSALALRVQGAVPGTVVVFDGQDLATTFGSETLLTALVPPGLTDRPAAHSIRLRFGHSESDAISFVVTDAGTQPVEATPLPAATGPLTLLRLRPDHVVAGQPFQVQPDGSSALAVEAENAVPGTVIVLDGRDLRTDFGNPSFLSAIIPPHSLDTPGKHSVYLRNGASQSNAVELTVTSGG